MSANSRHGQIARTIWERVAHFEMPPTAARALLKLQFSESDRQRMQELSAKARSGNLSVQEDEEATVYEQLGCLLDVLHSQARRSLKRPRAAS